MMSRNVKLGGLFWNQNRPKSDRVSVRWCETRFPILIQRKAGNFLASYPHLEILDRPPSEESPSLPQNQAPSARAFTLPFRTIPWEGRHALCSDGSLLTLFQYYLGKLSLFLRVNYSCADFKFMLGRASFTLSVWHHQLCLSERSQFDQQASPKWMRSLAVFTYSRTKYQEPKYSRQMWHFERFKYWFRRCSRVLLRYKFIFIWRRESSFGKYSSKNGHILQYSICVGFCM